MEEDTISYYDPIHGLLEYRGKINQISVSGHLQIYQETFSLEGDFTSLYDCQNGNLDKYGEYLYKGQVKDFLPDG